MHKSHVIEIDGNFVGAALTDGSTFRFVAVDARLDDLDGACWPTLQDLRCAVRGGLAATAGRAVTASSDTPERHTSSPPENRGRAEEPGLERTVSALREQVMALASISGVLLGFFCKEGGIGKPERLFSEVRHAAGIEEPATPERERIVAAVQNVACAVAHEAARHAA